MKTAVLRILVLTVFLSLGFGVFSQTSLYSENKLVIESSDITGKSFKCNTGNCYMVLNTSSGDFTLSADLSSIRIGDKKVDSLMATLLPQILLFKGNIDESILKFNQQQNDEKNYDMPGLLTLNDVSLSCKAQFDPINLADKSESKNYRIDFMLSIEAGKLTVKGLEKKLAGPIVFQVAGGKLNIQN